MPRSGKAGGKLADVSHFFLSRIEGHTETPSTGASETESGLRSRDASRDAIWITSVVAGVPSAFLTTNLAVEIARRQPPVRIVDLETGPFTAPLAMGISPAYSALFRSYLQEGSIKTSAVTGPEGIEIVSTDGQDAGSMIHQQDITVLVNLAGDQDVSIPAGTAIVFAEIDPQGLLTAYEWLKGISEGSADIHLGAVFVAPHDEGAKEGFGRLASACQRFLGRPLSFFGHYPSRSFLSIHQSLVSGYPLTLLSPDSEIASAFADIASRVCDRGVHEADTPREAASEEPADPPRLGAMGREPKMRPRPRVDIL
jgi:hypothetical protein